MAIDDQSLATTNKQSIEQAIVGSAELDEDTEQYLTFVLGKEEYGVDILRVQEIKGWDVVTEIPNTPAYIRGVINIRGTIVPIIDLRLRFRMEFREYGATTVVIVLKVVADDDSSRIMGIVVDGVSDVYTMKKDQIKPAPDFGEGIDSKFVTGLATVEEKMVIMLDIDFMLNADELRKVNSLAVDEE